MLNKTNVENLFKESKDHQDGLTVTVFDSKSLEYKRCYRGLPCYGSIPNNITQTPIEENVYVFPWNKSSGRQLLFQQDSPFTDLLDIVYTSSYKEDFTFEEFKSMCLNKGIILEGSMLKDWCSASFMALVMAGRDTVYNKYDPAMPFKEYRKNYSSGSAWFPSIMEEIEWNTLRKLKPFYDELNYPKDNGYLGQVEQFLYNKLGKGVSNWTSGTDVVYFLVTGIPVGHRSYRDIKITQNQIHSDLLYKYSALYQRDPKKVKSVKEIERLWKESPVLQKQIDEFNKKWKVTA